MSGDLLGDLWTAANVPGPERGVLALTQSEASALLVRLALASVAGSNDGANVHEDARRLLADYMRAEGASEGEIDARLHSLFDRSTSGLCEWCDRRDATGYHDNGCRLGLGPDELHEVNYECPRCLTVARWTDGQAVDVGDERNEFWCQTCGAESPLEDCRVVAR